MIGSCLVITITREVNTSFRDEKEEAKIDQDYFFFSFFFLFDASTKLRSWWKGLCISSGGLNGRTHEKGRTLTTPYCTEYLVT